MANLNKYSAIGRLTRDPESKPIGNGGKLVKFGFAVTERKKNPDSGQMENSPVFLDCEAFNAGDKFKLADIIEQYCKKGSQIYLEGRLSLDSWQDKNTGDKRTKIKVIVGEIQLLDKKDDSSPTQSSQPRQRSSAPRQEEAYVPSDEIPF